LLLKDLAQGGPAKFDVSAYATTTYDKLLLDLLYLNKSKYHAKLEKVFWHKNCIYQNVAANAAA
jgi:hypothetical protein